MIALTMAQVCLANLIIQGQSPVMAASKKDKPKTTMMKRVTICPKDAPGKTELNALERKVQVLRTIWIGAVTKLNIETRKVRNPPSCPKMLTKRLAKPVTFALTVSKKPVNQGNLIPIWAQIAAKAPERAVQMKFPMLAIAA